MKPLLDIIWMEEELPKDNKESIVIKIPKNDANKNVKTEEESLINVTHNIFYRIISE